MPLDLTPYRIALAAQKAGDDLTASADHNEKQLNYQVAIACHAAAKGWYLFGNALLEQPTERALAEQDSAA